MRDRASRNRGRPKPAIGGLRLASKLFFSFLKTEAVLLPVAPANSALGSPTKYLHDNGEKYRREKDAKEGDPDHSGENGGAQGLIHLSTCPFGDHQGQHAQDKGKRGHE